MASNIKMLCRILNPKRASNYLGFARRSTYYQDHNTRQIKPLYQIFRPRNFSEAASTKVEETNQVCSILVNNPWSIETEERLSDLSTISEDEILVALNTLIGNPSKARRLFKWYTTYPSYKPTSSLYNTVMRVVCQENHLYHFWNIVEEMQENGFSMEPSSFSNLILRFYRYKRPEDMAKLFLWLFEDGKDESSVVKCCQVLSGNGGGDDDPSGVVQKFLKDGGQAKKKMVYNGLHRYLTKDGRLEEAEKVMEVMIQEGPIFGPDHTTYGYLVYGLCNADRLEEARQVIHEMRNKGMNLEPKMWKFIIDSLDKANKTDEAVAMCEEMIESRENVSHTVITSLACYLCDKKRGMDAYNLMCKGIEGIKMKPAYGPYMEVVNYLTHSGMVKEALNMLGLMKGHGYTPIVDSLCEPIAKFGTADDAFSLIKKARKNGMPGRLCINLVKAFYDAGKQSEGDSLVARLPDYIAKTPDIWSITKGTSSGKRESEVSTKKGDTFIEEEVVGKCDKAEQLEAERSITKGTSSGKRESEVSTKKGDIFIEEEVVGKCDKAEQLEAEQHESLENKGEVSI